MSVPSMFVFTCDFMSKIVYNDPAPGWQLELHDMKTGNGMSDMVPRPEFELRGEKRKHGPNRDKQWYTMNQGY